MRYHNITKDDMLNGDGLRVVLWVAGCGHHCKGCQNPITWDPNGGIPFDDAAKAEIFEQLDKDYTDVVVDGRFILAQRDVTLEWKGSPNQRVIDVKKTRARGEVVLFGEK